MIRVLLAPPDLRAIPATLAPLAPQEKRATLDLRDPLDTLDLQEAPVQLVKPATPVPREPLAILERRATRVPRATQEKLVTLVIRDPQVKRATRERRVQLDQLVPQEKPVTRDLRVLLEKQALLEKRATRVTLVTREISVTPVKRVLLDLRATRVILVILETQDPREPLVLLVKSVSLEKRVPRVARV